MEETLCLYNSSFFENVETSSYGPLTPVMFSVLKELVVKLEHLSIVTNIIASK